MSALDPVQQRVAKLALLSSFYQHQVAAFFGCNQGRISEFKNSELFDKVVPASELPEGFPLRH